MVRSISFGLVLLVSTFPANAETWEAQSAKVAACFAAMDRDPALAIVNARFARRDPTPAQLADGDFANAAESDALRLRVLKTRPCRDLRLAAVRAHRPLIEPSYSMLYYQADQVFDYLIQGSISYGEANRLALASFGSFEARERAYEAADEGGRRMLSQDWLESLQRGHSEPSPPRHHRPCRWRELNIVCD